MSNPYQRNEQWFLDRAGCLTASVADSAILRTTKGQPLAAYESELNRVVAERFTKNVLSRYCSPAMQWGIDHEDEARDAYEVETGNIVELVGFIKHPTIPFFGASPDGLVGKDGLIEIKCPETSTHIDRIRQGVVPDKYKPQMLAQLLCTGRKWVDFVDFDPRIDDEFKELRLFVVRYEPTAEELETAKLRCIEFLEAAKERFEKTLSQYRS